MKVTIDREECIDCGVCYAECPEVFEEDSASQIVEAYRVDGDPAVGQVPEGMRESVQAAADGCPVEAIHVE
jgi:ferredoxin